MKSEYTIFDALVDGIELVHNDSRLHFYEDPRATNGDDAGFIVKRDIGGLDVREVIDYHGSDLNEALRILTCPPRASTGREKSPEN